MGLPLRDDDNSYLVYNKLLPGVLRKQRVQTGRYYCLSERTSHKAWIIPGTPIIKVSIIFIQKCLEAPTCINAATGGRIIERIIFTIFISHLLKKIIASY